jgi:hypothetical protein
VRPREQDRSRTARVLLVLTRCSRPFHLAPRVAPAVRGPARRGPVLRAPAVRAPAVRAPAVRAPAPRAHK